MITSSEMKPATKWLIVVIAAAAAALSLWLTIEKLTGQITSLAGCGAGSGCANVLGSKWSMVFAVIPVSIFSFFLYVAVIVSLWVKGSNSRWFRMLAGWMFVGAAVWFTALQFFVLNTICPYCMTMHGLGVVLGVLLLLAEFKGEGAIKKSMLSLTVAIAMVAGLAAVQYFGPAPETHRVDDVTADRIGGKSSAHNAGEGRLVSFFDGKKSFRVEELPHMGSAKAEHVVIKYYDYTCDACREVHSRLETILAKYPDDLAVIVLPVPLNKSCNPNLPLGVTDHENACEFAKLALRVWRADQTKFLEFHSWLFEYHAQPYEAAEAMAYSLVGVDKMEAVDSAWVEAVLKENIADYKMFVRTSPVMPKVLLKGAMVLHGMTKDLETFERVLKQNLGF